MSIFLTYFNLTRSPSTNSKSLSSTITLYGKSLVIHLTFNTPSSEYTSPIALPRDFSSTLTTLPSLVSLFVISTETLSLSLAPHILFLGIKMSSPSSINKCAFPFSCTSSTPTIKSFFLYVFPEQVLMSPSLHNESSSSSKLLKSSAVVLDLILSNISVAFKFLSELLIILSISSFILLPLNQF